MQSVMCVRLRRVSTCGAELSALFLTLLGATATPAALLPAEAYASLPAETEVVLSPDGQYLAWIDQKGEKVAVVIYNIDAHKMQRRVPLPADTRPGRLRWGDSGILLMSLGVETTFSDRDPVRHEMRATATLDVKGGDARFISAPKAAERGSGRAGEPSLVRAITSKPHTAIMASGEVLLEVDTLTRQAQTIKWGNIYTQEWIVDSDGTPVARQDWDALNQAYRVYALHGDKAKEILRKDDNSHTLLAGLLPDASALVVIEANGRPYQAAWAYPLDGSPPRILVEDPEADVFTYFTDQHTGAIASVYLTGSKNVVRWLDPAAQRRFDQLSRTFPGRTAIPYAWTDDGNRVLVQVQSPTSPSVYYLVDFAAHRADIAAEEYPQLATADMGEFRPITYKARDGTRIPAYLTMPVGKSAGPVPLVVFPHAGPNWRDEPYFNWMVQFLASRGYAVLQPQFRGSTGYGEAFREAGYRQWGGLMQDDVTDGVYAMVEQGIADPGHVCIAGMGYGGYVALAGAAFTPKLYACAISIDGISDIRTVRRLQIPSAYGTPVSFGDIARAVYASPSYWKERVGSEADSLLETKSPVNSADKIGIPVLFIYSADDPDAVQQSEPMAQAMLKSGKQVSVVKLAGEAHWLAQSDTRQQVLKELEAFLKAHL